MGARINEKEEVVSSTILISVANDEKDIYIFDG
jgi:hypothetical protein